MFNWEDGELVEQAYVIIDGEKHYVTPAKYKGTSPMSAANLNAMQKGLMELVFPIGATYTTQDETNPANILEFGTWERLKGKVVVGLDEDTEEFNEIGKEGGETTHVLANSELPKHGLSQAVINSNESGHSAEYYGFTHKGSENGVALALASACTNKGWISSTFSQTIGNNNPHNNLQPYKVVGYIWVRTA